MTASDIFIKRTVDFLGALLGLLLFVVPMCIIAFLIKTTSKGPVFFIQTRVGRSGKLFGCVKFRTMRPQSEQHGTVTSAGDPRITRLGTILRRCKLDELPQLCNVLAGHMSFVGPRPDVPGYADNLQGKDRVVLELYPGITGPATLLFRHEEYLLSHLKDPKRFNDEVIFPEKVRQNILYFERWSIFRDIGYIVETILPKVSEKLGIRRFLGIDYDAFHKKMQEKVSHYNVD